MKLALVIAVLSAALVLGAAAPAGSATPDRNAFGPSYKYCKSFKAKYRIYVYARKITCRTARKIQREYWLGPRRRKVIRNGGTGASGYVLLKRFPGWKCVSGSGGGSCNKGRKSAAYQN